MADEVTKPKRNGVKLGERLANLKRKAREALAEAKRLKEENDALKAKPTDESIAKERDQLKGQIRSEKHRKAFDAVAAKAGVRPEALEDLWELSKLDTSSDEPDTTAITAAVGEKVKARPYLVGESATSTRPDPNAPLNPGAGSERGARTQSAGMTVKYSELADGVWMRANQDRLHAAQAEGTVTYTD